MSVDSLISLWKDVRTGLIQEVERIPADQFSFRATDQTRTIAEILQHIIQSQRFLVGETCRENTNLARQSFPDHVKEYGGDLTNVTVKDDLLAMLRSSMDDAVTCMGDYDDKLDVMMTRFDGKQVSKQAFLTFAMSHEMYHRGQLTVYERLLNIEPVLTERLKKLFAGAS
ncbi:MAG: hypothetical protein C5B55_13625 [Blastocatellia bacterium]|nr:MAG: hypothetical protein C5B55_13625 [Blastocatellia bacterium]